MSKRVPRLSFKLLSALAIPLAATIAAAQGGGQAAAATPMINQSTDPLLRSFRFRSIGPASMGGRIDDIEVSESDPNTIYIGYATAGVW